MFTSASGFQFRELPKNLKPYEQRIVALLTNPKIMVKSSDVLAKHPWQSKIGGMPYLPKGTTNPLIRSNPGEYVDHLVMLFQINFEELPQISKFPTKGILQFFTLNEDPYEENSKLIYYDKVATSSEAIHFYFSDLPKDVVSESRDTPEQGIGVNFECHDFSLIDGHKDHLEIQQLFSGLINGKERVSAINDFCEYLDALNTSYEEWLELKRDGAQYDFDCTVQIGGNVFQFWNGDPREMDKGNSYHDKLLIEYIPEQNSAGKFTLPLQGHDIRCQFFIGSKGLDHLHFHDYLYHGMI